MKNKKFRLTIFVLIILIGIAIGFFLKDWSEPMLWIGLFTAIGAASTIFTGGNYLEKKEYIKADIEKDLGK